MITASLLFVAALAFAFVAAYYFMRNEKETKQLFNMEEKLQKLANQEKSKLISVISSLADGVIVLDSMLKPWVINDAARSFLAITREFPLFDDIERPFPQDINLQEKIKEVIELDRTVTLHEVTISNKTFQVFITPVGEKQEVQMNSSMTQHIIGASLLLQDITAEKSLEKMKEEFSHVIVHELRAPVAAIKDAASLMVSDGLQEDEKKNMLNLIHDQAKKLLTQISSILDAAKVDDGKLMLKKTPGNMGKVVQDEVALFLPEAKRKNITLIAEIANELPTISFDNIRITQVINNVLSNSLKYTNENGVIKITVDTDETYIRTKSDGCVVVTVMDNGIGIPEEKQHMLFTKFGQLSTNASKETQKMSSGLGLYITKGIVEAHGGTIAIHSSVGKGTTTTFSLPINTDDAAGADEKPIIASMKAQPGSEQGLPLHPHEHSLLN